MVTNAVDWNALPQPLVERFRGVFGVSPESLRAMLTDSTRIDEELQLSVAGGTTRGGDGHVMPSLEVSCCAWSKTARSVRIRSAWVDFSSAEATEIAARTFGSSVLGRPSPWVLLVDSKEPRPENTLTKAGIRLQRESSPSRREGAPAKPSVVLSITPEKLLRDKVRQAKRNAFSDVRVVHR